VTIARSIANSPDILLLDEPTGDLDSVNTMKVMALLTRLNKEQGITLVMVTHDIGLKYFADRILWMRDGKLQRVEEVSAKKREEMHENLRKDMEILNVPSSQNNHYQV
jgi:putative ABC transport system ATP-binding protein